MALSNGNDKSTVNSNKQLQQPIDSMTTLFTPDWRRPRRDDDVVMTTDEDGSPFWWSYPCLVCGKPPPPKHDNEGPRHKRCARCKSTVYCSSECQKQDFTEGKHKANCVAIGKLWEEKKRLEECFWKSKKTKSTNPFDDDDDEYQGYPVVGDFWHDRPNSELQKNTVHYSVTLLQLVQLLGRGESWRVSRIQSSNKAKQSTGSNISRRRGEGNPLARELALDLAYQLLHLDRTDMRVRLLIPSLLLEKGDAGHQEAYDYLKYWLQAETSMMIMDLALMGGEDDTEEEQTIPFLGLKGEDILESPEQWIDGEMIYPSIGMVFELAFLKCTLLCSLKSSSGQINLNESNENNKSTIIAEKCITIGEEELERQVKVLLSLVHKWNPELLPRLAEPYTISDGALSSENASEVVDEDTFKPATPPGLNSLLNKQPPGFELQYKMGNPGGQTLDEAVAIWQRDMTLWHNVDPMACEYLVNFCKNLQENLVSVESLKGIPQNCNGGTRSYNFDHQENEENASKRKEAEELVRKLKDENPDRTMDQIMMHPEMAQLMCKHLNKEN